MIKRTRLPPVLRREPGAENAARFTRLWNVNPLWISVFLLAGTGWFAGCEKSKPPTAPTVEPSIPTQAQPKLQTIKVWLGSQELITELALNDIQQQTGMMFRTNIAENEGMLFVFPVPHRASFWMKNTLTPLSAAYIDSDGVILEIRDFQPQNTNAVVAASDRVQYVLETKQGWFQRNTVGVGTVVRTERGSLMDTFFRKR